MHYKTDQKNVLSVQYQLFQLFHIFLKFCYLSSFNYDNIVAGKNNGGYKYGGIAENRQI